MVAAKRHQELLQAAIERGTRARFHVQPQQRGVYIRAHRIDIVEHQMAQPWTLAQKVPQHAITQQVRRLVDHALVDYRPNETDPLGSDEDVANEQQDQENIA